MMIDEIIDKIKSLNGVLEVFQLTNQNILNIIDLESERREELVPVFNQGIQECFKRDISLVIFKKGFFRVPPAPTLLLIHDGEVLGHDIFCDKSEYENDEDIMFLSDDFIIFRDVLENNNLEKGNEYFLLPPVPFPELDDFTGICDVMSASPSTISDEYLKQNYGFDNDSSVATILVSFNFK